MTSATVRGLDFLAAVADNINVMAQTETIQFQAPQLRKQLESEAARLNLSVSAYLNYLHARLSPDRDSARLDRHVQEVFGKHGDLMRRLAK